MASVGMNTDITALVDATVAGNTGQISGVARELIERGAGATELIGRIGLIAARGDSDGHTLLTLASASMMCRWFVALQHLLGEDPASHQRELPLLVQSISAAIPATRAGNATQITSPEPLFPSELPEGETVATLMLQAVMGGDVTMVERLLLGLHGTGADYRAMHIRLYDSIATSFQDDGHQLLCGVRGFQLLDAVEYGTRVPVILHWMAPHVPARAAEPAWIQTVRDFLSDAQHSFASYRTRLAAPKEESTLALRRLVLSDAAVPQLCQAVFDAVMKQGASAHGVASVITLAAADLLQRVSDESRDAFVAAAHGLLYTSAARAVYTTVQEVESLPLLLTAACAVNALYLEQAAAQQQGTSQPGASTARSGIIGGGLIAPALLETLSEQLAARDVTGAHATARRYIQLGHNARAMFATIANAAAHADATADAGHTLQLVHAAGEAYITWPAALRNVNIDNLLHAALRAAALADRNTLVENL